MASAAQPRTAEERQRAFQTERRQALMAMAAVAQQLPTLIKDGPGLTDKDKKVLDNCRSQTLFGSMAGAFTGSAIGAGIAHSFPLPKRARALVYVTGALLGAYPAASRSSTSCMADIMTLDTPLGDSTRSTFRKHAPDSEFMKRVDAKIKADRLSMVGVGSGGVDDMGVGSGSSSFGSANASSTAGTFNDGTAAGSSDMTPSEWMDHLESRPGSTTDAEASSISEDHVEAESHEARRAEMRHADDDHHAFRRARYGEGDDTAAASSSEQRYDPHAYAASTRSTERRSGEDPSDSRGDDSRGRRRRRNQQGFRERGGGGDDDYARDHDRRGRGQGRGAQSGGDQDDWAWRSGGGWGGQQQQRGRRGGQQQQQQRRQRGRREDNGDSYDDGRGRGGGEYDRNGDGRWDDGRGSWEERPPHKTKTWDQIRSEYQKSR